MDGERLSGSGAKRGGPPSAGLRRDARANNPCFSIQFTVVFSYCQQCNLPGVGGKVVYLPIGRGRLHVEGR